MTVVDCSKSFLRPWSLVNTSTLEEQVKHSKGRFTHSTPYSCSSSAMPLRVYNVSFPFDLHSAAMYDSHLPSHAHVMRRPCCCSQGHGTVRPLRDSLWATCTRSASSGYHTEFHEGYQKYTNLRRRWPVWNQTTFVMDEEKSGSSTLQKRRSVELLD